MSIDTGPLWAIPTSRIIRFPYESEVRPSERDTTFGWKRVGYESMIAKPSRDTPTGPVEHRVGVLGPIRAGTPYFERESIHPRSGQRKTADGYANYVGAPRDR